MLLMRMSSAACRQVLMHTLANRLNQTYCLKHWKDFYTIDQAASGCSSKTEDQRIPVRVLLFPKFEQGEAELHIAVTEILAIFLCAIRSSRASFIICFVMRTRLLSYFTDKRIKIVNG